MDPLKSVKLSNFQYIKLFRIPIQNIFIQMPLRFTLHCSYSYTVFTLQLHIVKNFEFKEEEIIAF